MSSTVDPKGAATDRRVVTVLYADIVGSTEKATAHDPEQLREGLALVFDRARRIIESHGGTVEKFIGDQVMAVFGIPQAHDDDAERAVRAALELHRLATELSSELPFTVRFRVGVNTGEVAAGSGEGRDFLVTGLPVIVGARLYPAAEPGGTLAGSLTRSLTESVIRYEGPLTIEGKGTGRLEAWRVEGPLAAPGEAPRGIPGLHAPLVGRDAEIETLQSLRDHAARARRPHLVTVIGEAGIGKSRLLRDFAARIGEENVRVGRCLPYGEGIRYHAIRSMLARDFDVGPDDDPAVARAKIVRRARAVVGDELGSDVGHCLAILMGHLDAADHFPEMNADQLAAELRWGFRRYIEADADQRVLVLVFEDLHWGSEALLDLVEDLAERADVAILVCCLARPELVEQRAGWGAQGTHASTLRLRALDPGDAKYLVMELLRLARLPDDLVAEIVARSGGNPLYLEEVVRSLISAGHLVRSDEGWVATTTPGRLEVPDTLRGIIASRLDRLRPATKELLQRASVLGRFFSIGGLSALGGNASVDPDAMREAVRADFLIRDEDRMSSADARCHFRHALIRDAVYGSIGKRERRILHERAADWLSRSRDDLGTAELVAHHLEAAYRLASELRDADRATIGRRAYGGLIALAHRQRRMLSWPPGVAALFDRAQVIAEELALPLSERKDEVAWQAAVRHIPQHHLLEQTELFAVIERVRGLGPTTGLATLLGFAAHHDRQRGPELAAEGLAVARAAGEPETIAWALWFVKAVTDPKDRARHRQLLDEVLALARRHDIKQLLTFALVQAAEPSAHEGKLSLARQLHEEAYAIAKSSGNAMAIANSAMFVALGHAQVRDPVAMDPYIDEAVAAMRAVRNLQALSSCLWQASWAEYQNGLLERARAHAEEAVAVIEEAAWPGSALEGHHVLARTCAKLRDLESARAHLGSLSRLAQDPSQRVKVLVASAHVAQAEGHWDEAERLFTAGSREMDRPDAELMFGRLPWDWARALNQEDLADLLGARGRTAEAKELYTSALGFWSDPFAWRRRAEIEAKIGALGSAA